MQDTVDPAAVPPRTLAQSIEDARRAELNAASLPPWPKVSAGDPVTRLLEGRGEEAIAGPQVAMPGTSTTRAAGPGAATGRSQVPAARGKIVGTRSGPRRSPPS
jgi:hypothetical protein